MWKTHVDFTRFFYLLIVFFVLVFSYRLYLIHSIYPFTVPNRLVPGVQSKERAAAINTKLTPKLVTAFGFVSSWCSNVSKMNFVVLYYLFSVLLGILFFPPHFVSLWHFLFWQVVSLVGSELLKTLIILPFPNHSLFSTSNFPFCLCKCVMTFFLFMQSCLLFKIIF